MVKKSPQIEEYLETLVRYKEAGREPRVKDLARDLGITAASVSQMLRKLSERGLVKYEKYGNIKLTTKGDEAGRAVLRKHRLIEKFLAMIGIRKHRIHNEACVLEHAISDDVEQALRRVVRSPEQV
ncbi:DtxR family iron (metal) dependent repressor, partial [Candidatus Micrarchaeota archaeon]